MLCTFNIKKLLLQLLIIIITIIIIIIIIIIVIIIIIIIILLLTYDFWSFLAANHSVLFLEKKKHKTSLPVKEVCLSSFFFILYCF